MRAKVVGVCYKKEVAFLYSIFLYFSEGSGLNKILSKSLRVGLQERKRHMVTPLH